MPDVTYMDGAQMLSSVASYGAQVVGMSASEAASSLGATGYETNGLTEIITFPMSKVIGGETASLQGAYASQMWDYWKLNAEAADTTMLGAAAAAVTTWASGVLIGDSALAGTLAGTGGLLTMTVPTVASLIGPMLGVSIGNALYQSNPEFWTKISQTLLPWAYKDTNTVGAVVDEDGQVYLPEDMVNALKDLFEEENVGGESGYFLPTTLSGVTYPVDASNSCTFTFFPSASGSPGSVFTLYSDEARIWVKAVASGYTYQGKTVYWVYRYLVSDKQTITIVSNGVTSTLDLTSHLVRDGKVVYFREYGGHAGTDISLRPQFGTVYTNNVSWVAWYGEYVKGGYPEGTSEWEGDSVDLEEAPKIDVVTNPSTGSVLRYIATTLPVGDPTVSNDPEVESNPLAPVEAPQITPFISPVPIPEAWPESLPSPDPDTLVAPQSQDDPVYIPQPDLNPELDPSLEPDPEPAPDGENPPQSDGTSPSIVFPPVGEWPSIVPSTGSGLVHVYNPTPAQFISFGNWLWVTYADPSIEKLWNNPFDGVIGAHELYATPATSGSDTIKSGFLDSGINSALVRVRYTTLNCGSIVIPEYYGNYFDYSPYSKAYIYLPFIGIVEVDVDDIVGHAINICYHIDAYNGSCIAQVTVAKDDYANTVYQFSGNCAVDLPLAGGSQSAIRAGLISAAAYGIGSVVNGIINGASFGSLGGGLGAKTGGLVGGVTGAVSGVASGIANAVSQKSSVQHSGTFGASYGAMGIKKPYIIIRRPVQKQVNQYQLDYGFPAHKRVVIGACTGFLRVREVNVQSTLATDDEKLLIENLLKTGVYVT